MRKFYIPRLVYNAQNNMIHLYDDDYREHMAILVVSQNDCAKSAVRTLAQVIALKLMSLSLQANRLLAEANMCNDGGDRLCYEPLKNTVPTLFYEEKSQKFVISWLFLQRAICISDGTEAVLCWLELALAAVDSSAEQSN